MIKINIILFVGLLLSKSLFAADGMCECTFSAGGGEEGKAQKISGKTKRAVICDSCAERCNLLIDKVKASQGTNNVVLKESKCP